MMPPVNLCDMTECFFNQGRKCHASAINIGGSHPQCDTFTASGKHASPAPTAMVGACKVEQCRYNTDMQCTAQSIAVGQHLMHADCKTFEAR